MDRLTRRKGPRSEVWWVVAAIFALLGYVELNSHVLQLGAADHDALCSEH